MNQTQKNMKNLNNAGTKMEYLVLRNIVLRPNESQKRNWTFLLRGETEEEILKRLVADGRIGRDTISSREFLTAAEANAI